MIEYDTVLRARRLVTAGGEDSGGVGVAGGRIAAISPSSRIVSRRPTS